MIHDSFSSDLTDTTPSPNPSDYISDSNLEYDIDSIDLDSLPSLNSTGIKRKSVTDDLHMADSQTSDESGENTLRKKRKRNDWKKMETVLPKCVVEKQKSEYRRMRNKEAAQLSRKKKKKYVAQLERESVEMKSQIKSLTEEVSRLQNLLQKKTHSESITSIFTSPPEDPSSPLSSQLMLPSNNKPAAFVSQQLENGRQLNTQSENTLKSLLFNLRLILPVLWSV